MSNENEAFRDIFGLSIISVNTNIGTNDIIDINNNFYSIDSINTNIIVTKNNFTNNNNINNNDIYIGDGLNCNNIINSLNITLNNNLTVLNILKTNNIQINNDMIVNYHLNVFNKCYQNNITTKFLNANNISLLTNITCNNNIYANNIYSFTATTNNLTTTNLFTYNATFNTNFKINQTLTNINNITCNKNLNAKFITATNDMTSLSLLYTNNFKSNNITCNKDTTIFGNINVSNNSIMNKLFISGILNTILLEFQDNKSAKEYGLENNTFYRTGDIIKVVVSDIITIISLIGSSEIILYVNDTFNDPGVNIDNNYSLYKVGFVNNKYQNNYNIYYNAIDNNNNIIQSVERIFKVYNYPVIVNIIYDNTTDNITITTSGQYYKLTYQISNDSSIIVSEKIGSSTISLNTIISNINKFKYTIIVYLKRSNDNILTFNDYIFYK